jgi:hypothetical protein
VTTNWSLKRDEDEGFHLLDSPAASFRFVFWAGAEACPNERQKVLALRLKIFKIGKLRTVILFDTLFQVIERGDIVLVKALSTGKNFLSPIPLFCIKLGTIGVLLRHFYSRKDL